MVTQAGRKFWNGSSLNDILIDDEDAWLLKEYSWNPSQRDFNHLSAQKVINGKTKYFKLHRLIMKVTDPKIYVDHINRNPLDNRKSNLRICSALENSQNRAGFKNCKSVYKGVRPRENGKFQARITVNGKIISGGCYDLEIDAARKYNDMAIKYFGEFAFLNEV